MNAGTTLISSAIPPGGEQREQSGREPILAAPGLERHWGPVRARRPFCSNRSALQRARHPHDGQAPQP
jgi:hypothetical protein